MSSIMMSLPERICHFLKRREAFPTSEATPISQDATPLPIQILLIPTPILTSHLDVECSEMYMKESGLKSKIKWKIIEKSRN